MNNDSALSEIIDSQNASDGIWVKVEAATFTAHNSNRGLDQTTRFYVHCTTAEVWGVTTVDGNSVAWEVLGEDLGTFQAYHPEYFG